MAEPRRLRFDGFEGIHLVADVWGDEGDWPVLLMHGGQTWHAWSDAVIAFLQHDVRPRPRGRR